MRSFNALALGLTLVDPSDARVADAQAKVQNAESSGNAFVNWFGQLFRKDVKGRAALDFCAQDAYYNFAADPTVGKSLCQALMHYPNSTSIVDYTPVSTQTNTISTRISTVTTTIRTTPVVTATESQAVKAKRDASDAEITVLPRAENNAAISNAFAMIQRQIDASSSSAPSDPEMSASFSSACACQTYGGSTVTSTYTNAPSIETLNGVWVSTTTVQTVRTAAASTTTITLGASSPSSSLAESTPERRTSTDGAPDLATTATSSSSNSAAAIPTAPAFTCPEDNNTTVSQMLGTMRYDYLVLCEYDLSDSDVYAFSYITFGECAAACSATNTKLNGAVCQGFSYYNVGSVNGNNCFLKASTGGVVAAVGVDSGLLQRIAEGLSSDNPAGTTTDAGPFSSSATQNPSELSSIISTAMANSSTTISVTAPPIQGMIPRSGLLVNAGQAVTSFSTYVYQGTTFSTGSVFSTYFSGNGSWYSSYYTTWVQSWEAATTVYAASETGTAISNSTSSSSEQQGGENGDYYTITTTNYTTYLPGGGSNITQVVSNVTYNAQNSQIASTATTYYYSYSTGGAGSGGGGAIGGTGAGLITSSYITTVSTGVWSTYTVISNSGVTNGGSGFAASDVQATPAPSPFIIVNTYSTAGGSGYAASGQAGGNGGASSTAASGAGSPSLASFSPISSTVVSGILSGQSGAFGSSGLVPISSTVAFGATGGASGNAGSGVFTPISSTVMSSIISDRSGFAGSGAISSMTSPFTNSGLPRSGAPFSSTIVVGSTGAFGGTAASGGSPSTALPFTNSGLPRSGSELSSTPSPSGGTSAPFSPLSSTVVVGSTGEFGGIVASGTVPSAPSPFTNSGLPRSGSPFSSVPAGTGSLPVASSPTPVSFPHLSFGHYYGSIVPGSSPSDTAPGASTTSSFTNSGLPRSGYPFPSGTGPAGYPVPSGSAPSVSPFTNSGLPRSGSPVPSGPVPVGTAPLGTGFPIPTGTGPSTSPFTNSGLPRSGSGSLPAPTGTAPLPGGGSTGFPPYPTASASCVTNYLGTTTVWATVTQYGCYSNCPPAQGGYGGSGGPNTFGPPVVGGGNSYGDRNNNNNNNNNDGYDGHDGNGS